MLFLFISMDFGTVFVVHSSSGSCYYIKNEKAGIFVPPNGQSHPQKTAKISHFYASYGNHFHRRNSQDIWPHSFKKSSWSSTFDYIIRSLENCSQTDFDFPHVIQAKAVLKMLSNFWATFLIWGNFLSSASFVWKTKGFQENHWYHRVWL